MKKLLIIAGILVALAPIAFVALQLFLGNVVTAGVNKFAPQVTQTTVTLASARISPLNGHGTLNQLVVGNPKGWSENNLCSLGKVHLSVAPFSIFGDHIVINEVDIDAPEFNYETKIVASNVKDFANNIEAAMGSGQAAPVKTASGKPIRFEVKKFRLQNAKVRVGVAGKVMLLSMPAVEFTDLGTKEGGITADQLVVAVMNKIIPQVVATTVKAAGEIGATSGASAAEGVKNVGNAIKGLFGGEKKP
jgi:hypothetical protein